MGGKGLTADEILAANDCKPVPVEVPEWGGTVYLRPMDGKNLQAWEEDMANRPMDGDRITKLDRVRGTLLQKTLCDAEGNLLFSGNGGIDELEKRNGAVLTRLTNQALRMHNLGAAEVERLQGN